MRKIIFVNPNDPASIAARVGSGVRAYVFGSVARGEARPDSDLDVYVAGPCAEQIETKYYTQRPATIYEGETRPLHVVGPSMVGEDDFLRCQPEAQRVL